MAKTKTTYTGVSVDSFLESFVTDERKMADSLELIRLMRKWSGCEPRMWGPTIIGFGNYHYRYASGHEGDAPLLAFSPRKAEFSLYVYTPTPDNDGLIPKLGKFRMGKSCIYMKRLSDIDLNILECISRNSIRQTKELYGE